MAEKEIGEVTHWYDKIGVAVVKLKGLLKMGDKIKIKHGETEFEDNVLSMQVDRKDVGSGDSGDEVAIKLANKAKEGSQILRVE